MMYFFLFEIVGLVFGILGSSLLLTETVRFGFVDGRLAVCPDEKVYRNRLRIRKVGIILLLIGFLFQLVGAIARITT